MYALDDSVPVLTSNRDILTFIDGGTAFLLMSNNMIRINYRGIRVSTNALLRNDMQEKGWTRIPCNISSQAMCKSDWGYVFPVHTPEFGPVLVSHGFQCKDSSSKVFVNYSVYDISACDIIQENLELVYVQGYIFVQHTNLSLWKYWVMIICSILVVRAVSLNVISKLHASTNTHQYTTNIVILVTYIIIISEGDRYYITENDLFFFWTNIFYISGYLIFHAYHSIYKLFYDEKYQEPRIFNLAAAMLQSVVMRFYGSTETPYSMVIIGVLCTRIWEKEAQQKIMYTCTGMVDTLYVSLLIYMGYTYDPMYLFPLVLFTKILSNHMIKKIL
jgi:hypothetical protein